MNKGYVPQLSSNYLSERALTPVQNPFPSRALTLFGSCFALFRMLSPSRRVVACTLFRALYPRPFSCHLFFFLCRRLISRATAPTFIPSLPSHAVALSLLQSPLSPSTRSYEITGPPNAATWLSSLIHTLDLYETNARCCHWFWDNIIPSSVADKWYSSLPRTVTQHWSLLVAAFCHHWTIPKELRNTEHALRIRRNRAQATLRRKAIAK